jgi:hypothetical protein
MMEVDGIIQAVAAVTWFRPPAETRSSFFSRLAICTHFRLHHNPLTMHGSSHCIVGQALRLPFFGRECQKLKGRCANGADGISDIEGKAERVAASEWSRRAAGDIDGQTERSKWAGAHESIGQRASFNISRRLSAVAGSLAVAN